MRQPVLDGVRVLDLSSYVAGPYCTRLLADYGADVVKVERAGTGDVARTIGPFPGGKPDGERSGLFLHLNANKRSVALNLDNPGDQRELARLVRAAAVVVDDGLMDGLACPEIDEALADSHAVITRISPFGRAGPYCGFIATDIVLAAMGGWMYPMGDREREPLQPGGPYLQYVAGLWAAVGTLAALFSRAPDGQQVDVSMFEAAVATTVEDTAWSSYTGEARGRYGPRWGTDASIGLHRCADGHVLLMGGPYRDRIGSLLPPGSLEQVDDWSHGGVVERSFSDWAENQSKVDVFHAAQALRLPFGFVATSEDIVGSRQLLDRDYFREVNHPHAGPHLITGAPFKMDGVRAAFEAAPTLGQDSEHIWRDWPLLSGEDDGVRPSPEGSLASKDQLALPLDGLRVVDLTMGFAGPLTTKILAAMGCEVIKVESCTRIDWWRGRGAADGFSHEQSPRFNTTNLYKKGVTIDLQREGGIALLRRLVEISDVVIENYSSGVMARLGIDYQVLRSWKPDILMVSMPAFGKSGPWRDYIAFGQTVESMSGLTYSTGYQGGEPRLLSNGADPFVGVNGAVATLLGLLRLRQTGVGQFAEVGQVEAITPFVGADLVGFQMDGQVRQRIGNRSERMAPHGCYPALGEDEWIVIAVETDEQWTNLARVIGGESLARDARYTEAPKRLAALDELDLLLTAWTAERGPVEGASELQRAGVAAGPVLSGLDLLADPQLLASKFHERISRRHVGEHLYPHVPIDIAGRRRRHPTPAPMLGEHNDEVFRGLLGLSAERVAELRRDAIIGERPRTATI